MALIGNYSAYTKNPGKEFGGSTALGALRSDINKSGHNRGRFFGWANLSVKNSQPIGNVPPYSWVIAYVGGGMASSLLVQGLASTGTVNLAGGKSGDATLAGVGDITDAAGQLILSAVATIAGSGDFTADIAGKLEAVATLAADGALTASMGALADAVVLMAGSGTLTDVATSAIGTMTADLTPFTELSPQSLAQAVWNEDMAGYLDLTKFGGAMQFLHLITHNKVVTDPASGTMKIYADDGTTVIYEANIFEDAAGTTAYSGAGAERRDGFETV